MGSRVRHKPLRDLQISAGWGTGGFKGSIASIWQGKGSGEHRQANHVQQLPGSPPRVPALVQEVVLGPPAFSSFVGTHSWGILLRVYL